MAPATAPHARLAVGPVLGEAVVMVARHWMIIGISLVAMAECALLAFELIGRCFSSVVNDCVAPDLFYLLGDSPVAVQDEAMRVLNEAASFVVLAMALYFFYSSEEAPGDTPYLRLSWQRASSFFGRTALLWLILIGPLWIFDAGFARLIGLFPLSLSSGVRWAVFLCETGLMVALLSWLHTLTVLYLPSLAFSNERETLRSGWRKTRYAGAKVFLLFFVPEIVFAAAQIGLVLVAYRFVEVAAIAKNLVGFTGLQPRYLVHALPRSMAFIVVDVFGTLYAAALSIIVFRKIVGPEARQTAEIFA